MRQVGKVAPSVKMGPSAGDLARAQADIAQEISRKKAPSTVTSMKTGDGVVVEGQAGTLEPHHPKTKEMLDNVPVEQRSKYHGNCGEINCLDNAHKQGIDPQGAEMQSAKVRKEGNPAHGQTHEACSSCAHVADQAGVKITND